jgi:transposase-like protein
MDESLIFQEANDGKKRRPYSKEFKAEVLEFSIGNTNIDTIRQFNIPESTLRDWIKKAEKTGEEVLESVVDQTVQEQTMGARNPKVKGSNKYKKVAKKDQVSIVEYGMKHNSWKLAGQEFGVSPHTLAFWGKKAGFKILSEKPKVRYGNSFKHKVVNFGVEIGWKGAAKHFGVSEKSVGIWAKEFGKLKINIEEETKNEILSFAVKNKSWKMAANRFGVSANTVAYWARKEGYKLPDRSIESEECSVCDIKLEREVTLDEHVLAVHVTIEGRCDICGESSEVFIDQFKTHLKRFVVNPFYNSVSQ